MMVGAVEGAARVGPAQPVEGLLVADVHAQSHLGLAAIPSEVALTDQKAQEEADREIITIRGFRIGAGIPAWPRIGNH
jgi:hypothetical protein